MINRRTMMKGAIAALAAIGLPTPQTTAFTITPSHTVKGVFVGSSDTFVPEMWARESLKILEENMVVGEIVHRDFSEEQLAEWRDKLRQYNDQK